jgi:hypothetical protein
VSFLPSVAAAGLSDANTANTNGFDFGDFLIPDIYNNVIHAVWSDNTTTLGNDPDLPNFDLATAAITVNAGTGGGTGNRAPLSGIDFAGADAGSPPYVRVTDLATGATTQFLAFDRSFTGGVRVAHGDISGDGVPDLIVAAGPGGGPHVKVYDGAALAAGGTAAQLAINTPLRSFFAYAASFTGGVYVAAGDVNGDGIADIITGAGGGPHVGVFDGATGAVIREFFAYGSGFTGGVTVAAGDVDGDGIADIITGAGAGGGPHVKVFSGATAAVIRSFFAYSADFRGGVYVAAGDVDGDGRADIVTGAGPGGGPHVKVFSGATGQTLFSFFGATTPFSSGVRVAAVDLNADAHADILVFPALRGQPIVQIFDGAGGGLLGTFDPLNQHLVNGIFVG